MNRTLSPAELEQRQDAPIRHGAHSEARIVPLARAHKRRLLRQAGLRQSDLEGIGAALLDVWSRAASKVALMDAYFAEHGFLDENGEPRAPARVYFTALAETRRTLERLEAHLRDRRRDAADELHSYLETTYGDGKAAA